jgi:hypothetical protein
VALALVPFADGAGLLDHWQVRNPNPVAVALEDVLYTRRMFVAVGEGGTILVSESGTNWNSLDIPSDGSLWSLCEGPGALFAVGDAPRTLFPVDRPTILRSTNGLSWTEIPAPEGSRGFRKIIYAQGILVAAGLHGQLCTSTDGLSWRNQSSDTLANILGLAFGNGVFVAGTSTGEVITSTNATKWSVQNIPGGSSVYNVVFANGAFLASVNRGGQISKLITSADGVTWTDRNAAFPTGSAYRVSYADGLYFATGYLLDENQGIVNISTNGIDWISVPLEHAAGYNAVTYGAGNYVMAGTPKNLLISASAFPTNAASWQSVVTRKFQKSFSDITYGAGIFVAVGAGGNIARSSSGQNWTSEQPPRISDFVGVAYGNEKFLTAGNSPGLLAYSSDGSTWFDAPFVPPTIATLFFGNNLFLMGGLDGAVLRSTDGLNWQSQSIALGEVISRFAYGNGTFLCVSSGGIARVSTDGITWKKTADVSSTTCAFGAGQFIAAGSFAAYYTSPDAVNWKMHPRGDYYWPDNVAYLRDTFLLFGHSGSGLYSSPDAVNWSRRFPRTGDFPVAIGWAPDTFVMLAGSSILQSGGLFTITAPEYSNSGFTFQVGGSDPMAVVIEASNDLQTWSPATNYVQTGASSVFPAESRKFYRGRAPNHP